MDEKLSEFRDWLHWRMIERPDFYTGHPAEMPVFRELERVINEFDERFGA